MMGSTLRERAKSIVEYLAGSVDNPYHGSSSMTPSVYDTAWVAMVSKEQQNASIQWLFPECFQSVLESQTSEGGFGGHHAEVDGILNTMAAVLALVKHEKNPSFTGCATVLDLRDRIDRGRKYLEQRLQAWDVEATVHVGFEILVPSLLGMLVHEGLSFKFQGLDTLMSMHRQKLGRHSTAVWSHKTTLLHSLEAFDGRVDFDLMAKHLSNGAMMGSPSSTAAYLMNRSNWDNDAETYLRFVVTAGKGWLPSAFPISIFEITWV